MARIKAVFGSAFKAPVGWLNNVSQTWRPQKASGSVLTLDTKVLADLATAAFSVNSEDRLRNRSQCGRGKWAFVPQSPRSARRAIAADKLTEQRDGKAVAPVPVLIDQAVLSQLAENLGDVARAKGL